jgi:exosortase D (VPLPA-CTERM-specific)
MRLHFSTPFYALAALALAGAVVPFAPALAQLYDIWNLKPEYSYGIIIPALSLFLIWRQRSELRELPLTGSGYGLVLIVVGFALRLVGQYSTATSVTHYAFLLVIYGLVLALTGPAVFRRLSTPLLILVFMVPLPMFFNDALSLQLQLISSQLGVWVIRAAGISVFLDGNVIDLGSYQLQVADACSGLRYLFPLMTLSFLVACMFRGSIWKKAIIFLTSIPVTVLMNSLRIGVIGITVEQWGTQMAEGLLHEFEGWFVFMCSMAVVLLVAFLLSKPGSSRGNLMSVFAFDRLNSHPLAAPVSNMAARTVPRTFVAAAILVAVGAIGTYVMPQRHYVAQARTEFVDFPSRIGDWVGQRQTLENVYLDALHLDDYVLANYSDSVGSGPPINFYVAYYQQQSTGRSIHSPHDCLPAGGWTIRALQKRWFSPEGRGAAWPANRVIIEHGDQRQLVYYWFEERGRHITNEQMARWYLFWDSLTRNRTDGALVRIVIPMIAGVPEEKLDATAKQFVAKMEPQLSQFVPN